MGKTIDLYPTVGLQHSGEAIRANFGQDPFKYDIDYHVQQQYNATWGKIMDTTLERYLLQGHRRTGFSIASITNDNGVKPSLTEEESKHVLKQLVTSYLVHHGYAKTIRALEKQHHARDRESNPSTSTDGVDHDVEMNSISSKSDAIDSDIESRTNIVNAVLAGDIDTAIESTRTHYPTVLEIDNHLILFKFRCRKFVELILETTEIKKKMKALREKEAEAAERLREIETSHDGWLDEEMNMDIDDDAPGPLNIRPMSETPSIMSVDPSVGIPGDAMRALESISLQYESALNTAITYGQALSNDYQSDPRPELQQQFKKTLGIVAWEDPLEAGGAIADLASHDSRIALAHEINQAILSKAVTVFYSTASDRLFSHRIPRTAGTTSFRNSVPSYSCMYQSAGVDGGWFCSICRYATGILPAALGTSCQLHISFTHLPRTAYAIFFMSHEGHPL